MIHAIGMGVDQHAKMTRFPGFSVSNFDHPGVCATIRSLDRRTWRANHENRVEEPAYASGGLPVHQRHRQSDWTLSQYRSQVPSPTPLQAAQISPPAADQTQARRIRAGTNPVTGPQYQTAQATASLCQADLQRLGYQAA